MHKSSHPGIIIFLVLALILIGFSFIIHARTRTGASIKSVKHPEWSRNAVIYEVNVRQYTSEGTFNAFAEQMPRLKEMGIDILWFMPVNPIGVQNRKGTIGSYYSVKDYKAVNPEFGTADDFKNVVKKAHDLGMHVIIDWVANHTSWDNVWTENHPEFFTKDKKGNFVSPFDWSDVIDLNYDNKEVWNYMADAMKFWVKEFDIDGFRCDVAAMVPLDFWKWTKPQLDSIKHVFMLAEAHEPELHEAFDMTYSWQLKDIFVDIAQGKKKVNALYKLFETEKKTYPEDAYRMVFTTNHDENSWHGTDQERFGKYAESFAVITGLVNGMPLVYSGMESGLDKRLLFFEKDPIDWKESNYTEIYSKLFALKKENKALRNGTEGGALQKIKLNDKNIFAFSREKENDKVVAVFNLSADKKKISFNKTKITGEFKNLFSDTTVTVDNKYELVLEPYSYIVLTSRAD